MGIEDQDTVASPAGVLLNGRYLLGRRLGEGGFGSVYLAQDQTMHGRLVVVKIQLHQSMDNPWFERKFSEEIRALSLIDHPGVVSAIDSGRTPDGKPFLVMQYVDGVTLREVMTPEGMPLAKAAEILKQMGHALAAAHEKGIWHRDLKPENLMLQKMSGGGERVRLIDFGIATIADLNADLTTTRVAGSVLYMAPEQRMGQPSAAADIYAMGLIAYEMLTGRKPFLSDNAAQVTTLQKVGVRLKPSDLRPSVNPQTDRLILQSLEFDPSKRPADAREFGDRLHRSLLPTGELSSDVTRLTAPEPHSSKSKRPFWIGGAVLLVIGINALRNEDRPPSQPVPKVVAPRREAPPDDAAIELAFWDSVKDSTEPKLYHAYLSKYPNGQFTSLATAKLALLEKPKAAASPDLEKDLWNLTRKSSEPAVYESYLDRYPGGKHASAARKKLASLRENDQRNEAVRHRIDVMPEVNYWKQIQKRNDPDAYREYLEKYPDGMFSTLARMKLGKFPGKLSPP